MRIAHRMVSGGYPASLRLMEPGHPSYAVMCIPTKAPLSFRVQNIIKISSPWGAGTAAYALHR